MATLGDTLIDIEKLQEEMDKYPKTRKNKFIDDLFSFTTVYYFNILSHTCLDNSELNRNAFVKKYYSLFRDRVIQKEYIRWMNIGGIFVLWNIFERYINNVYKRITRGEKTNNRKIHLELKYKEILKDKNIEGSRYAQMMNEFNCVRLTRNTLHQGGVYINKRKREYEFAGKVYIFEYGKPVIPLRIVDIANVLWRHYKVISSLT